MHLSHILVSCYLVGMQRTKVKNLSQAHYKFLAKILRAELAYGKLGGLEF